MRITAEISLYPLANEYLPVIEAFIADVAAHDELEVVVNQLSTQVRGELDDVMSAVRAAMARSFASGDGQALVVKFLNADLPIAEPPELEHDR